MTTNKNEVLEVASSTTEVLAKNSFKNFVSETNIDKSYLRGICEDIIEEHSLTGDIGSVCAAFVLGNYRDLTDDDETRIIEVADDLINSKDNDFVKSFLEVKSSFFPDVVATMKKCHPELI